MKTYHRRIGPASTVAIPSEDDRSLSADAVSGETMMSLAIEEAFGQ